MALFAVMGYNAFAFDFSAVAPSGDTLYYELVDGCAVVVAPVGNTWADFTEPQGTLIIPSSVTCNGTDYPVSGIGDYAFVGCYDLTDLVISEGITSIGQTAFMTLTSLTNVTLPSTIQLIDRGAFAGCSGLNTVVVPDNVAEVNVLAFSQVKNVVYHGALDTDSWKALTINGYVEGPLVYADDSKTELTGCFATATQVTIPESVTTIGNNAFANCRYLQSVEVPATVTTIANKSFSYVNNVIYNGTATGSPWGAKIVNGYAEGQFVYTDATKDTLVGYYGTDVIVNVPEGVTTIATRAFYNLFTIEEVNIPASLVTIQNYAFNNGSQLKRVNFNEGLETLEANAFYNCRNLTFLHIPSSVSSIAPNTFWGCFRLSNIKVDAGNAIYDSREDCNAIVERATNTLIKGCANTKIPNTVTRFATESFGGNRSMQSLDIPASVVTIDSLAFELCNRLATVRSYGLEAPVLGGRAFTRISENATLYIPFDTYDLYYVQWSEYFPNIIETSLSVIENENPDVNVFVADGQIVVEGAENAVVNLYSIDGRKIATSRGNHSFSIGHSGVYLIQVNNGKAKKIVVL